MTTKLFDSFETLYNYLKPKVKSIKDTETKKALAKEVKTSFKKEGFDTRAIKLGDSPQDVIKHAIESKPLSSINKTTGTVKRYLKTAKELYKKYNLVINAIASVVAVGATAYGIQKYRPTRKNSPSNSKQGKHSQMFNKKTYKHFIYSHV